MPFFSVIIPLFNKEDNITKTLNSVINQTFTDFEVIIINDGSTDSSLSKVQEISDKRFKIINQENSGASTARNNGISLSQGNYIALLDADDFWHTNHLEELKKQIHLFPDAGLYCNNYEIEFKNKTIKPALFNFNYSSSPIIIKDYFKSSIINSVAWTSAVAFKKTSFLAIGAFNSKFEIAEDIDLWIRFALKYDVCFNPRITMIYKKNIENSLSKYERNEIRYNFINNYRSYELENKSLKLYLDVNRYAVALRCKMNNEKQLYEKLKSEIDFNNINLKQKVLLHCPNNILRLIKKIQSILLENNIYLSAYK
ncbi:glycosyltransferase family 2 protein [Aestuariibaculum lutulentum]|uniref:Glycosyltransferase family 2 protein n=1 Tax=Aestuariibaculum lutulentum TaxID=2920935 RepID=A0ABS9REI0_9FLAO|nr:glycosyltransferase family A protein [Aestuariibaculum lutulentum]MCH4551346.1 glycosyltransferase family 2 protein [Aestuariibaculum lutulentum]